MLSIKAFQLSSPALQRTFNSTVYPQQMFTILQRQQRSFQSISDHQKWVQAIKDSAWKLGASQPLVDVPLKDRAPLLHDTDPMADRLSLAVVPRDTAAPHTPTHSFLQVQYPLSQDCLFRNSVADHFNFASFRLGKLYETIDALTGDVAYQHLNATVTNECDRLTLVTGGHYFSRKLKPVNLDRDVFLRCYLTQTGQASLEVRTDSIQVKENGEEELINFCHTIMVALDPATMKSVRKVGKPIPQLVIDAPINTKGWN